MVCNAVTHCAATTMESTPASGVPANGSRRSAGDSRFGIRSRGWRPQNDFMDAVIHDGCTTTVQTPPLRTYSRSRFRKVRPPVSGVRAVPVVALFAQRASLFCPAEFGPNQRRKCIGRCRKLNRRAVHPKRGRSTEPGILSTPDIRHNALFDRRRFQ